MAVSVGNISCWQAYAISPIGSRFKFYKDDAGKIYLTTTIMDINIQIFVKSLSSSYIDNFKTILSTCVNPVIQGNNNTSFSIYLNVLFNIFVLAAKDSNDYNNINNILYKLFNNIFMLSNVGSPITNYTYYTLPKIVYNAIKLENIGKFNLLQIIILGPNQVNITPYCNLNYIKTINGSILTYITMPGYGVPIEYVMINNNSGDTTKYDTKINIISTVSNKNLSATLPKGKKLHGMMISSLPADSTSNYSGFSGTPASLTSSFTTNSDQSPYMFWIFLLIIIIIIFVNIKKNTPKSAPLTQQPLI